MHNMNWRVLKAAVVFLTGLFIFNTVFYKIWNIDRTNTSSVHSKEFKINQMYVKYKLSQNYTENIMNIPLLNLTMEHPDTAMSRKVQLETITSSRVLTYTQGSWQDIGLCANDHNLQKFKFTLRSRAGNIPIFTHDPAEDYISKQIRSVGAFQLENLNQMIQKLKSNPDVNLIDIGTNVGQYVLAAALMGRYSIAMDAAEKNIQLLCTSSKHSYLEKYITLVHNIISDNHDKKKFRYSVGADFATIHVEEDGISEQMRPHHFIFRKDTVIYDSVMLDDILHLQEFSKFKKVFIKIDIEGYEHRALLGAKKFFQHVDVRGILMEWSWHKNRNTSEIIKSLLTRWKFRPYTIRDVPLNLILSDHWPEDIFWLPL